MIRNRSPAKQRSYLSARVAVSTGILVDALPFSTSAGIQEMRLTGQRNVLLEGRSPGQKFGGTIYLRITAALSFKDAYDNPTPRHEAAASTKKSLIRA
jgi:hypothetical protein